LSENAEPGPNNKMQLTGNRPVSLVLEIQVDCRAVSGN
jgi:hypothetical protein